MSESVPERSPDSCSVMGCVLPRNLARNWTTMHDNWTADLEHHLLDLDRLHEKHVELESHACRCLRGPISQEAALRALEDLRVYAAIHFREEEKFFDISAFPSASAHRAIHNEYLLKIEALQHAPEFDPERLRSELNACASWMHLHLVVEDGEYTEHLQRAAQRMGVEQSPLSEESGLS